jgi:ubiquitin C-terminal hydrolase
LVIHLKRFANAGRVRSKISGLVQAPMELNVNEIKIDQGTANLSNDDIYDLYAVSNHFGGLGGGHCNIYFNYARYCLCKESY